MEHGFLRSSSLVPLTLLFLAAAILLLVVSAEAQTDPPASGDWTIGDNTTVENRTVRLYGNLTVVGGGQLVLRNVTLRVYSTFDVLQGIRVMDNGSLVIEDLDDDAITTGDRSRVMPGNPSYGYSFLVDKGARLHMVNSVVNGMGDPRGTGGVLVRTSGFLIKGTTFMNGHEYDLMLERSNESRVEDCDFYFSEVGLVLKGCDLITVENCSMRFNGETGLHILDSTGTQVFDGIITDNDQVGLRVTRGRDNKVAASEIYENTRGMVLSAATWFSLVNSRVNDTIFEGVVMESGCINVTIYHAYIIDCGRTGVEVDHAINLSLIDLGVWDSGYYGVRILNGSRGLMLSLRCQGNGYDGLHIENARDIMFGVSTFRDNGYNGMFIIDTRNVTTVSELWFENNTYDGLNCDSLVDAYLDDLRTWWNGYNGVQLQAGSHDIELRRLDARFNQRSGLLLDSAYNVTLQGSSWNNSGYGFRIGSGAYNVTASGLFSTNNTGGALRLQECDDIRFESATLSRDPSGGYMVYGREAVDVWISNSTTDGTVHLIDGCNVSLVNCAFDDVIPDTDGTSYLHYHTLVDVEVLWPNTSPAVGAVVNATGRGGDVLLRGVTGEDGCTGAKSLLMESYIGESVSYQNPYRFWARKGDEVARNDTNILGPTVVQIILQDDIPPVAVAPDVTAELGTMTTLDGTGSHDNGQLVSWEWSFDDGVGTVQLDGARVNWTFTVLGTFTGTLAVFDSVGMSNGTAFTIRVVDTTAPLVVAGTDLTVDQGTFIDLDGTATTDNDSTLISTGTFVWTVVPQWAGAEARTFYGPVVASLFTKMGVYLVELNVTDQSGNTGTDGLWITVNDTTAPSVDVGPDVRVGEGEEVLLGPLSVTDNDPDFDANLTARWVVSGPGTDLSSDGLSVSFIPPVMGTFTATLHVTDAAGNEGSDTVLVIATDMLPPLVDIGIDRTEEMLTELTFDTSGVTDNDPAFPDGASYLWRIEGPMLEEEHTGNTITFTLPWVGQYLVTLTVTDGAGNEGSSSVTVTSVDTAPPEFGQFSPGITDNSETRDVDIDLLVTDAGTGVDPDYLQMRTRNATGEWSEWQLVGFDGDTNRVRVSMVLQFPEGDSQLQLRCWDLAGNGPVESDVHLIRVNSRPRAVVLSPAEGATFGTHDQVTMDASASSDPDGDELFFRWTSDRDGLLGTNATIRAPPLSQGVHRLTVEVSDGIEGHDVLLTVTVTILPEPSTIDPDEGQPWWVYLAALLLVLGTGLVVWDHVHRRQRPPPPQEAEGWVETPEDEDWAS